MKRGCYIYLLKCLVLPSFKNISLILVCRTWFQHDFKWAICFCHISVLPWELPKPDHIFFVFPLSTDSQRSHLSSFTMKLMDKFHSPKIKRTPSKKGKQLQPEPATKSTEKPTNKVCVQPSNGCVYCGKSISFPPSPFVCLFVTWMFSCQMLHTPIFHCVPAGSHSFPVPVAAGCATAGVWTYKDMNGTGLFPEGTPPLPLKAFGVMSIFPSSPAVKD